MLLESPVDAKGEVVARHGELKIVNFSSSEIVFHIFTGLKIQHRI